MAGLRFFILQESFEFRQKGTAFTLQGNYGINEHKRRLIIMTKQEFQQLSQTLLLLDGATGSNLMAAGMPKGVCTETWILEHPDIFRNLQKEYAQAGSQVVYAPTFGANPISLAQHHLEDQTEELNRRLVQLSRDAVQGKAYIAGDITTTGKLMEPLGEMSYEEAFDSYCRQIQVLSECGVDFLAAETMISLDETLAALDAAQSVCQLPVLCSLTVEADGSLFTGGNVIDACAALEAAGASAVGINCSVGPDQLVSVVKNIRESVSIPVVAKPNAGMPEITDKGEALYKMTPEEFAGHMKVLVEQGASIVGGCCGTTPEHIRCLSRILN